MRSRALMVCVSVFAVFLQLLSAQAPPTTAPAAPPRLPLRRVILYKNGVGYFEHVGRVQGTQAVTIDFNSSQLNDVLKSLTTIDLGGGRVTNVSFNSEAPLKQRLNALTLPLGERATVADVLTALRGARVTVHDGTRAIAGRLLSVEPRVRSGNTSPQNDVTIVTEGGTIRSIELTPDVTVTPADREVSDQVRSY